MTTGKLTLGITLFFVFAFMGALGLSIGFSKFDGIGPWFASGVGLILSLPLLASSFRQYMRERHQATKQHLVTSEFNSEAMATEGGDYWKRLGSFLLAIMALYGSIMLVGLPIAFLLFLIIYPRVQGHLKWTTVLIATVIGLAFLVYFAYFLGLFWPEPLILKWIKLPRLLGGIS